MSAEAFTRMRFLSVADRELRSAARRSATYRTRWVTAAVSLGLLAWLMWVFGAFTNRGAVSDVFTVFSVLTCLYCLLLSTACTADSISLEKREGTLGFLFLTNLNSAEIIAGKLCSTALASVYGLLAIFPILALPLLMGGITFEHFARTILALLNAILFSLAAGFLSSVLCKRQFVAIALALGLTLGLAGGFMLGAAAAGSYPATRPLANWLALPSPLYSLIVADGSRPFGSNAFWPSAAAVAALSLGCLGLTTFLLARTWRDQPKTTRAWHRLRFWQRSERSPSASRAALRRRFLAINPMFWVAGRQRVSAPVIMVIAVLLTLITVYGAAPFFGRLMGAGSGNPVPGYLFSWVWAGLAIHALVLYYAAMSASQRLAEDKQSGALELILSTPITERAFSRGLWLAYARKMFFPALLAVLVHLFVIWILLVMATLEPPGLVPTGLTPGEIFWGALLNQPIRGQTVDWQFGFVLRIGLVILLQLILTWPTLGWVARWLGLRMKHPAFAPAASLALLIVPPILLFSFACYLAAEFNLYRLSERLFLPMLLWLALGIGIGHCLALSLWAASRLRHDLRLVAMSRYQPLPPWRWRLPTRRAVRRFALAAVVFATAATSLVFGYYSYQNWRSHRAWKTFQTSLNRSGNSLSLSPLLPEPVPDDENFARSPAFLSVLSKTNRQTADLFDRLRSFEQPTSASRQDSVLTDWSRQTNAPLNPFVNWNSRQISVSSQSNRQADAAAILQTLNSQRGTLQELAASARRRPAFQVSTNHDSRAVLHPVRDQILVLERLHLLLQVRACASLALGQNADAADDLLTGLGLARLARQLPDARSTVRVQGMLVRSLQPLWEGLSQRAWTGPQLAAFQAELANFNLLADYTNSVRRVVLAHIEIWRAIPDSTNSHIALPTTDGYMSESAWQLQPRAWWFQSCIQLHNAGRNVIENVDAAAGRIKPAMSWSDLEGLPLDYQTREMLQQSPWWGPNPASVAFVQTSVNQATIACALERFRLVNGGYPETLEQLVPAFLSRVPHDAISGRPLVYQPVPEGSFTLRGVGPNGTVDQKNNPADDWLWTYSTNRPSVK